MGWRAGRGSVRRLLSSGVLVVAGPAEALLGALLRQTVQRTDFRPGLAGATGRDHRVEFEPFHFLPGLPRSIEPAQWIFELTQGRERPRQSLDVGGLGHVAIILVNRLCQRYVAGWVNDTLTQASTFR